MNFAAFQEYRNNLLRQQSNILDFAETNLYQALSRLSLPETPPPEKTVHRCHLATEWTKCFGLETATSSRALISCGVRDSLALLFRHYASLCARLWLPEDNYPVYAELSQAARLSSSLFSTLPEPVWPEAEPEGIELLLVTNPLKPLGRWLSANDVVSLEGWLTRSPHRRLLLDAVYTFDTQFHPATLQLLGTGQTILLHSLTKGWLHPRLFGVALVPICDAAVLSPLFRAQSPPQASLARARELLNLNASMPSVVASELDASRARMCSALPAGIHAPWPVNATGYFTPVTGIWLELLRTHRMLGIPATVFGSHRQDITIISSLSFVS